MSAALIAAAAAPVVGGIIGQYASAADARAARDRMSEAIGAVRDLQIPDIEKQKIVLERLSQQGLLTPEMEAEVNQQMSGMKDIREDTGLRDIQRSVIEDLRQYGKTGLTAEDRAALNQSRLEVARDAQARQAAVLQGMAARGMGGSGMELAAQLQSSQASADQASQDSNRIMAMAQQKALQNLIASSNQASALRGQDFDVAARTAQAQDAINAFNANLSAGRQSRNVSAKNVAQATNLGEKQRIADTNVGFGQKEEIYNKELIQQQFQNQMAKANALSGILQGASAASDKEAAAKRAMWSQMGQGAGTAIAGAGK